MWTCEFVFGLVSSYLDGCDKQKRKKEKKKKEKEKNMMTCRVAAQLIMSDLVCILTNWRYRSVKREEAAGWEEEKG